jgi:hypothetical protein
MSIGPGPFFFALFGVLDKLVPLATSPVVSYKAPDALSSWTALGIHGYVQNYNERFAVINKMIQGAYGSAYQLDHLEPSDALYGSAKESLDLYRREGVRAVIDYFDYLNATLDSLVDGCQQLGVPLPMHGGTAGMKPVYTLGMEIPKGSWAIT